MTALHTIFCVLTLVGSLIGAVVAPMDADTVEMDRLPAIAREHRAVA